MNDVAHALACRSGIRAAVWLTPARMPALHAKEVAGKVGTRLPYGRGSESARRVYSHLLSRDRQGAVVLGTFEQPLKRAPHRATRTPQEKRDSMPDTKYLRIAT